MSESFSGNLTSAFRHLLQVDTKYTSGNKITPVLACKKNYIQYNTCFKINKIYIVFSVIFCSVSKCLRTLVGHTGGVWSSQMEDNIIISGSTDRTLKVWNADTGQCINTLYGHTSTVRCMHLHKNM